VLLFVRRIASSASASVSGVMPYLCKINGNDVKEGHVLVMMNYSHLRHGKGPQRPDAWRLSQEMN
jgi:hypothetical protein